MGLLYWHRDDRFQGGTMIDRFKIDQSPHNRDGLIIQAWDGNVAVDAFIGRRVMDEWILAASPADRGRSLYRAEYNALGVSNLDAISRLVTTKYERGKAHNRQHPYVEILTSDIRESDESLDQGALMREPLPPAFLRV
jgi:hypothetical protein